MISFRQPGFRHLGRLSKLRHSMPAKLMMASSDFIRTHAVWHRAVRSSWPRLKAGFVREKDAGIDKHGLNAVLRVIRRALDGEREKNAR